MRMIEIVIGAVVGAAAWKMKESGMDYGKNYNGTKRTAQRGVVQLNAMRNLPVAQLLKDRNVRAFLEMIAHKESGGRYDVVNGGCTFKGNEYPYSSASISAARKLCKDADTTAAGKYQFVFATWRQQAKEMGLKDFGPANQDAAAIGLLAALGALEYVVLGLPIKAIRIAATDAGWTSLPGGSEQLWDMAQALAYYDAGGGKR